MASHRRPKQPTRARVTVLTATAAAAVALTSQAAHADPKPSVKDVKAKVNSLYHEAEVATQKYDGAKEQEAKLQKQVDDLQDKVARTQQNLNTLRDSLGNIATAQYRTDGIDPSIQLFLSSNPNSYLDKASTLDQVSAKQAQTLEQIQSEQRTLAQDRQEAQGKVKDLASTRKTLSENKSKTQAKLAAAQKQLNTLTAAQQAEVVNAGSTASRGDTRPPLGGAAASGRAGAALAAAETRLGDAYVYGAQGSSTFDCSGLMMWSYAQAGVSIPRTSQEQAYAGTQVSLSNLQPGDLVIFFGDHSHVGMYVGKGEVIHAPYPGASVRYEAMSDMPAQFGVRIG